MDVAGLTGGMPEERKRSQSTNPAGLNASSNSGTLGFSLAGNRGANAANKNSKVIDNYLVFNIGNLRFFSLMFWVENKTWEKRKAKGKSPSQRCFFAYYYERT